MRIGLFGILFLLGNCALFGQQFPHVFDSIPILNHQLSRNWSWYSNIRSSIVNAEYNSPVSKGYTSLNGFADFAVQTRIDSNLNFRVGIASRYVFAKRNVQLLPIFQIQWQVFKNTQCLMGNLEGGNRHKLADALCQHDRMSTEFQEYGVQFLHQSRFIEADIWLNWQYQIQAKEAKQEEFVAGARMAVNLFSLKSIQIQVPIQFYLKHKGGEIDNTNLGASSVLNSYVGIAIQNQINSKWLRQMQYHFGYLPMQVLSGLNSGPSALKQRHGDAIQLQTQFQFPFADISAFYWQSNFFNSVDGEALFRDIPEGTNTVLRENSKQIGMQIQWNVFKKQNAVICLRTNVFYELQEQEMSNSIQLLTRIQL